MQNHCGGLKKNLVRTKTSLQRPQKIHCRYDHMLIVQSRAKVQYSVLSESFFFPLQVYFSPYVVNLNELRDELSIRLTLLSFLAYEDKC